MCELSEIYRQADRRNVFVVVGFFCLFVYFYWVHIFDLIVYVFSPMLLGRCAFRNLEEHLSLVVLSIDSY